MHNRDIPKEYIFVCKTNKEKINKKTKKKLYRESIYNKLKIESLYPDLVEFEDIKCEDPIFYNKLKNIYKTVPVIKRWKNKHVFPVNFIKKEYNIPNCIIETGLDLLRYNFIQIKQTQTQKEKYFEKMFPKFGKTAINPKKLYDCFHKNTPNYHLYEYGEVFDFSWENERKRYLPGVIDDTLKIFLGMNTFSPPPWLFKMQKIGLPPSYPNLKIPGVNTNIPPGCKYGYEPNGWGKPPNIFLPDEKDEYIYNLENQYTALKPIEKNINEKKSTEEIMIDLNMSEKNTCKKNTAKATSINNKIKEEKLVNNNSNNIIIENNLLKDNEKNIKESFLIKTNNIIIKNEKKKKKNSKSKLRQKF